MTKDYEIHFGKLKSVNLDRLIYRQIDKHKNILKQLTKPQYKIITPKYI